MRKRVIIMGAAGRDFHNFNLLYRQDPSREVVAFTAAQIPFIDRRTYPPELAGPLYPEGIPIYPEEMLQGLIKDLRADEVVFSYSDVTYAYVMHRASMAAALGASFVLPSAEAAMLESARPVISICAVRTGAGKSGITRYIGRLLKGMGRKAVAIRHPMPYGDLKDQRVQRFSSLSDLDSHRCTIEEMEEYEPLIESGLTVYAGVDYEAILKEAEAEAEIILWDGGNNDLPFVRPDLSIVVADPLRPGDELNYWPGEANLMRADAAVVNKCSSAPAASVKLVERNIASINPGARIIMTDSAVIVEGALKGRRALVVEDGPTLTHGGMPFGAGMNAVRAEGATAVDPRPYATGSIKAALERYPALQGILPAMGYSDAQKRELEETINRTPCDVVVVATPIDLSRHIRIERPAVRVRYEVREAAPPGIEGLVREFVAGLG